MANGRSSDRHYEYATVDTNPGADGYYTNSVNPRTKRHEHGARNLFFSIRATGVMTVTLQFRCEGDAAWTDYDTYTAVTRLLIEHGAVGVRWRAGVNNGDRTSGERRFGFDW